MSIAGGGSSGAFQANWAPNGVVAAEMKVAGAWDSLDIDASRSNPLYGSSTTVMPESINLPVILYLGLTT